MQGLDDLNHPAADKYDDPAVEAQWVVDQRKRVNAYLEKEGCTHAGVAQEPDWFIAPYLAIWRIASVKAPGATGWWAISGDCPTDYLSSKGILNSRDAMRAFSRQWREVAECMLKGISHPTIHIGSPEDWPELGDLLKRRAKILAGWAEDNEIWAVE